MHPSRLPFQGVLIAALLAGSFPVRAGEGRLTVVVMPVQDQVGGLDSALLTEIDRALRAGLEEGGTLVRASEEPSWGTLSAVLTRRPGVEAGCTLTLTLFGLEEARTQLQVALQGGCDEAGVHDLAARAATALREFRPAPAAARRALVGRPNPLLKDPVVPPPPSLDRAEIQRVIRANSGGVRSCYERALRRAPALAGGVTVEFTIGPGGRVTRASLKSSTLNMEAMDVKECILTKVRSWVFPPPRDDQPMTVIFPFVFSSAR